MSKLPPISIIVAVKNDKDHIRSTIDSVASLGSVRPQLIVVDGASSDGTLEIVKTSEHVDHWVSEPDTGVFDAMNKGWLLANPDSYVLFLGAGDRIISLPQEPDDYAGRDVLYGDVALEKRGVFRSSVGAKLRFANTLHHQGLMVRKAIHPEPPFDCRYPIYADFDFNQRLYKIGAVFAHSTLLRGSMMDGGQSQKVHIMEMSRIAFQNYGWFWGALSCLHGVAVRVKHAF